MSHAKAKTKAKTKAKSKAKSARQRYRDDQDEDYVQGYDGQGSSSEEEIVLVHESSRQRAKRRVKEVVQHAREQPRARTICWRWFLFLVVACLGIAMIIQVSTFAVRRPQTPCTPLTTTFPVLPFVSQLYSSYGEFITDQIFPPRVSSAGRVCGNGTTSKNYMLAFHKYTTVDNATTAGWLHLNATRPQNSLQYAWSAPSAIGPQESPQDPRLLAARWKDAECLLVWLPGKETCASVVVVSV